jgi:hypothetical protein
VNSSADYKAIIEDLKLKHEQEKKKAIDLSTQITKHLKDSQLQDAPDDPIEGRSVTQEVDYSNR